MEAGRSLPKGPLIAAALALVAVAGLSTAAWVSMKRRADAQVCAAQLRGIYIAVRSGELLDSPRWESVPLGRAFLAFPEKWPVAQRRDFEPFCPVKGTRDDIDFRGPARPFSKLGLRDPVLADRPGNHGPGKGGNVCLKNGEILSCREEDATWRLAEKTTAD